MTTNASTDRRQDDRGAEIKFSNPYKPFYAKQRALREKLKKGYRSFAKGKAKR